MLKKCSKYGCFSNKKTIFVGHKLKKTTDMDAEDKTKLMEVFKGSLWEAELVKGLLKDRGIESVVKDGQVVNVVLPETAISVKVLVNEADYEAAMEVIRERNTQTPTE